MWTCSSDDVTEMTAVASETWGLVFWQEDGDRSALSLRTVERRFRVAAGLTRGAVVQVERARTAAVMLAAGGCVADVVDKLGYYDEPHLARTLRRYVGRSAGQLRSGVGGAIALDLAQCTTS